MIIIKNRVNTRERNLLIYNRGFPVFSTNLESVIVTCIQTIRIT